MRVVDGIEVFGDIDDGYLDGVVCTYKNSAPAQSLTSEAGPLMAFNDQVINSTPIDAVNGQLYEVIAWKSQPSAGVQASLINNMRSYFGTPREESLAMDFSAPSNPGAILPVLTLLLHLRTGYGHHSISGGLHVAFALAVVTRPNDSTPTPNPDLLRRYFPES
jgi:hypothetical protein